MAFPKLEVYFALALHSRPFQLSSPSPLREHPHTESLQDSSFHQPSPAAHPRNPTSPGEAGQPWAEPSGAAGCFPATRKKQHLPDTSSSSRRVPTYKDLTNAETRICCSVLGAVWMGNAETLFPSTADCLQTGKADIFSFSWHQPKRALKGGMGWWENNALILFVLFMDS